MNKGTGGDEKRRLRFLRLFQMPMKNGENCQSHKDLGHLKRKQ